MLLRTSLSADETIELEEDLRNVPASERTKVAGWVRCNVKSLANVPDDFEVLTKFKFDEIGLKAARELQEHLNNGDYVGLQDVAEKENEDGNKDGTEEETEKTSKKISN